MIFQVHQEKHEVADQDQKVENSQNEIWINPIGRFFDQVNNVNKKKIAGEPGRSGFPGLKGEKGLQGLYAIIQI